MESVELLTPFSDGRVSLCLRWGRCRLAEPQGRGVGQHLPGLGGLLGFGALEPAWALRGCAHQRQGRHARGQARRLLPLVSDGSLGTVLGTSGVGPRDCVRDEWGPGPRDCVRDMRGPGTMLGTSGAGPGTVLGPSLGSEMFREHLAGDGWVPVTGGNFLRA